MNVNRKIENALESISKDIWPLCCPLEWPPDTYIVYNPELEETSLCGDDEDLEWAQYMQVHYYTKEDYTADRKAVRKALRRAGFTVTEIITMYEKDSGYYHLCFECSVEEEMED